MKIVVDAFGGDNAPFEIIKGAVLSLNEEGGFSIVLAGKAEIIAAELAKYDYDKTRVEILDAREVITNDERPTEAVRTKKDSSIVKSFTMMNKDDDAKAFVSAGSTGAVLTGAMLMLKRIKGVDRPGLAPVLPTVNGKNVILMDCGANSDCRTENLVQFAHIGSAYAKALFGLPSPKAALLSNGTEDKKGNALNKEAFPLLKEDAKLNFLGNMEAREILSGEYDVVIADGFSGNIALKGLEGAALSIFDIIKQKILAGGLRAKLGYLLLKPALKEVKKVMDYNDNGGAALLGLAKIVVKSHGSSKAKSIKASILQAKQLVDADIVNAIASGLND